VSVTLRAGGATHVGRFRTVNEDAYALYEDRDLFVLADGMGGHLGGDVASRLAIDTIESTYQDPTAESLIDAIEVANHRIRHEGDSNPELRGMGTTIVALARMPNEEVSPPQDHLVIANIGDSRGYLFRDGTLTQVTEDHSVVADLVREGRITAEEAEAHPQRNIVTRVLGPYAEVEADLFPIDPVARDRYLLCSDGLFNEVGLDQIASVLRRLDDPEEAAHELVRLANEGGGRDNITVVLVDVVDDGGVAEAASGALSAEPSELTSAPAVDPAGFTTALAPGAAGSELAPEGEERPSRRERREARRARRQQRTRFTWRTALFCLLLLGIIGGALATIQWYGTSTYFVTFDADEVVVYRGRPGGVLWVDPELVERTGIDRADVPARYLDELEGGNEQPSRPEADELVANIERDIEEAAADERPPTTAPTTTTTLAS